MLKYHKSKPYNPHLANTFFRAGYVEAWGRGIEKVREICAAYGCPEPEYEILGNDLTVTFHSQDIDDAGNITSRTNEDSAQIKLTKLEQLIIAEITINPSSTQDDIAVKGKVTKRAVQKAIKNLQERKIVERTGSLKKGAWRIIDTSYRNN